MEPNTEAFFASERCGPLSRKTAWLMVDNYSELAGFPVEVHPHMWRHACGEDRWGTVGEMDDGKLYLVVWTKRNGRTRIIAAYRADDWEIRAYRALYGGAA